MDAGAIVSALCGPGCGYCGRCSAAWEREDEDGGEVSAQLPASVRVETRRDGYQGQTFLGATADSFDRGVLTISAIATEQEIRVFGPHEWLDAVAYDRNGNVLFDIVNPTPAPAA